MKISELIDRLKEIQKDHGDISVVGGVINDDTPLRKVIVINDDGCDFDHYGGDVQGVFLEG